MYACKVGCMWARVCEIHCHPMNPDNLQVFKLCRQVSFFMEKIYA